MILLRHVTLAGATLLVGCVGPGSVKEPVRYEFHAEEGAEILVDTPVGFRVNAKGPVRIITEGAALYVTEEVE